MKSLPKIVSGGQTGADRAALGMKVLNVAGPRASKEPGVGEFVMRTLDKAFTDIGG